MYVEFHPYAFILHIFRKTYFDVSSLWFQVLFLTKLILRFNVKNIGILFTWILFIHTMLQNVFLYLIFVSIQVLEKTNFHFKILSFEK